MIANHPQETDAQAHDQGGFEAVETHTLISRVTLALRRQFGIYLIYDLLLYA